MQNDLLTLKKTVLEVKRPHVRGGGGGGENNNNNNANVRYEDQVGGGIATSTPDDFELLRKDEMTSQASARLYKDLAEEYEKRSQETFQRLQEAMEIEKSLRQQ